MKLQDALNQLARETARARRGLAIERGLRLALPLLLAAGAWAAIALSGLHERLPLLAQTLTATAALVGLIWLGVKARRAWRPPTEAEARARLAADSELDTAAFEALRDRPSRYDALSVALWRREQDHAREHVARARALPARPKLADIDPLRLRFILPVVLLAALVWAGASAPDRLARAFIPDPGPLFGDSEMAVEAWATPAAYTHAAPVSLSDRLGQRIETPPSVEVTVRVTGPAGAPNLVFDGGREHRSVRFTRAADGAWEARMEIPRAGRLKIVRFHTRGFWRMAPAPDAAPRAVFAAPLTALPGERVAIAYSATDDFGLTGLALRVRPVNPPEGLRGAAPVDTPFESPAGDPKEAQGESELEIAEHPYAGMEVEARIVAFDALGQAGESAPLRFTMPEKVFLQPVAQAAIEIRRHILHERRPYRGQQEQRKRTIPAGDILLGNQRIEIRDYERNPAMRRAPQGIQYAARLIEALTMTPEDHYYRDLAVYLGLRRARSELDVAQRIEETNAAADILWRTALRAEYGGALDARRQLELAQQALAEALRDGAPQERVRQLMEALRRATENYLQALVQEAMREQQQETQEDTEEQAELSGQDIEDLLEQVQNLAEQGRTQEAQALLQQLAAILANLDVQLTESEEGQSGQQGEGDQQQMQESMDQLSETIGEQRALRDETQQEQQAEQQMQNAAGGSGGEKQGGQGGDDMAARQAEIREALGEAQASSNQAGAAPSDELNAAGQAMQQAENALRRGDLESARAAQDSALENLRRGADQLAAQIREGGRDDSRQGAGGPRDPLGRTMPGPGNAEGEGNVPTQIDPARSREILDEIRRRAQDPNRPESEREYLRRLLDRFSGS